MTGRTVSVREGGRLARSITVGPHLLTADEPEPLSTDTGPTPGELLLAALGSCTSMAVRAYARRQGWPLDHVGVDVRFGPRGQIVKHVRLTGELEPSQVERLLKVAGRCPVQRLITGDVSVATVPTVVTTVRRIAAPRPLPE
ncbi:OsmC family protein [Streptomyces sp. OP7]|uniref:OsmC family protein n=1 Tax=Streptomyces sp. OP7 TaxID=3142462 RepID=UPI0032E8EF1B